VCWLAKDKAFYVYVSAYTVVRAIPPVNGR